MTHAMPGPPEPTLAALVDQAMRRLAPGGGPMPEPSPPPTVSTERWRAETALARSRHDSTALEAGYFYDSVLREALGPDPLGIGGDPIDSRWDAVPVEGGTVGVRIYTPFGNGPHPVVLLAHGGAYWMGGGAVGWHLNDPLCRRISSGVRAVVVNVDHRLAPEHPHPVPLDDVAAVVDWIVANAVALQVDAAKLALFGISSGGNLVAAASHRALDGIMAPVAAVVLQCASLDLSVDSSRFGVDGDAESVAAARRIVALYAGAADPEHPAVSPGRRSELRNLPPTLVITGDHDPLTGDAVRYADRLERSEVPVTRHSYPMTHTMATPKVYRAMCDETVSWLKETLG